MADEWVEYRKLVLAELERLNDEVERLQNTQQKLRDAQIELKIRASFLGLLAGAIPVAIAIAIRAF